MTSFLLIIISPGMIFPSDLLKLPGRRGPDKNLFIAGMTAPAASGISAAKSGSRFFKNKGDASRCFRMDILSAGDNNQAKELIRKAVDGYARRTPKMQ